MRQIKRLIAIAIGLVVGISAMIILMAAVRVDKESEAFLKETDAFIAKYETEEETEKTHWVKVEAADNESNEGSSSVTGRSSSGSSDNSDTGDEERVSEDSTEKVLSIEELAEVVLNAGINGDEREAYLGSRYVEVQNWIDQNYVPPVREYPTSYNEQTMNYDPVYYDYPSGAGVLTPDAGINYYYGTLETYYNLDMSGVVDWMHDLGYGGDYWIRSDGVKMLGNNVMVAADYGWMPKGSIVETSLGTGIVCDTGLGGWYWLDIAVDW